MVTENPARILNLNAGKIEAGARADFAVFDDDIQIVQVFVNGNPVQ
jgi:N-acetylglucosamine-6-phosphate deacetylase